MGLRQHDVTLIGSRVTLRPLTEDDWDVLLAWNSDPEILHSTEAGDVRGYDLAQVQEIYRGVSQSAYCFIAEVGRERIGECWLQEMNLARILRAYPGKDCRRIDLIVGQKRLWGRGLGTDMIRLLTTFAFARERADLVFACGVADFNAASLRAFRKAGYAASAKIAQPAGGKARHRWDLKVERAGWIESQSRP